MTKGRQPLLHCSKSPLLDGHGTPQTLGASLLCVSAVENCQTSESDLIVFALLTFNPLPKEKHTPCYQRKKWSSQATCTGDIVQ